MQPQHSQRSFRGKSKNVFFFAWKLRICDLTCYVYCLAGMIKCLCSGKPMIKSNLSIDCPAVHIYCARYGGSKKWPPQPGKYWIKPLVCQRKTSLSLWADSTHLWNHKNTFEVATHCSITKFHITFRILHVIT